MELAIKTNLLNRLAQLPRRGLLLALAAVLVILILVGVDIYQPPPTAVSLAVSRVVPYPVAYVHGRLVLYRDFWRTVGFVEHTASAKGDAYDAKKVAESVLTDKIDRQIFGQAARELNIKVTSKEVDDAYQADVKDLASEKEIADTLSHLYGMTIADYKAVHADLLVRQKVTEKLKIDGQVKVGQAKHVLIALPADADEKTRSEAETRAQQVLDQAKKDLTKFDDLAKQFSEDKGSRDQGGEIGQFTAGQVDPAFEEAVFAGTSGQLVDHLVRSKWGYHVILVEKNQGKYNSITDWLAAQRKTGRVLQFVHP